MNFTDFLVLAAEGAEEHKVFNLLDFPNNVLNWVILAALVVWIWNKVTPSMFAARHENIEGEIREAHQARLDGEKFLVEQRERVANAEAEAEKILTEAKTLAAELKKQVQDQTTKEIADMKVKIESSIKNERSLAVTELRQAAAKASVQLTREVLPSLMTSGVKANLLNQFVNQLDETARAGEWDKN